MDTVYGQGGYDPQAPGGNVVEESPTVLSNEAANELSILEKLLLALDRLEQADANWDALTPTQKDAAVRYAVRCSAKLIRLTLRRLEVS